MTVSTEVNHNEYTGNGVTTTFPYAFRIFQASDLLVTTSDTNGTLRTLTLNTDYTVSGVGSYSGGTVILPAPLSNGWGISIERDLPVVQETDLRNQGRFFAETHEGAFDYLTMLIQQCFGWLRLALLKPNFLARYYDAKQNRIANLADPNSAQDAVNNRSMRNYVDSAIAGVIGGFGWFIQYGSGAVYRTFQDKMRDQISALDFTMNADGLNDDTANFSILETEYIGRVVNLCGKSFKVSAPPTLNTYIDGKFITTSLDTGLPVTIQMGTNSAVTSSKSDTGEFEARYLNPLTGDYQPSGRSTPDLYVLIASQNSRSSGPARAINAASIYSYASGNISGNVIARQCRATVPQTANIASEDCRADQGFRGVNLGSITSHATGETAINIGSRRAWATGFHTTNIASVDAVAGGGKGAILSPTVNSSGVITGVSIISGGTGYSQNGSVRFYDRLSAPSITATATYTVNTSTGAITSITMTNGGMGYSTTTDPLYEVVQVTILDTGNYSANIATANGCATYGEISFNLGTNNCAAKASRSGNIAGNGSRTEGQYAVTIGTELSSATGGKSMVLASGGSNATADLAMVISGTSSDATGVGSITIGRRTLNSEPRSIAFGDASTGGASSASRKFHLHSNGNLEIAGALIQNQTFTDIAKMFENTELGEISIGAMVAWEGRKVRLAIAGDIDFSVHSRTYATLLGDSQFTWSDRWLRDEWGVIVYHDIPDPDWQERIEDPEWPREVPNPAHPAYDLKPLYGPDGNESGQFQQVLASEEFIPNPEPARLIPNPVKQGVISVPLENPDYDPQQKQVPRSKRKEEWTPVALIGEVHTMVDETVAVDDFVKPGDVEGLGTKSETPTKLRCMEITAPFSLERGYAIALCLRD